MAVGGGDRGPWTLAELAGDGRTLSIFFTGLCGTDPKDLYRANVQESADKVVISVYGPRPYSNLCAGAEHVDVHLAEPLGSRSLVDGYDKKVHRL